MICSNSIIINNANTQRLRRPPVNVSSPRYTPRLSFFLVYDHAVVRHIEGDIGHMQEVVGEILFDNVALIAAADHEVF